jgi:membrane-bound lytic murein transglycosylase
MKAVLHFFILVLLSVSLAACAGRDNKNSSPAKRGFQPLSEAEAKVYITPTIYYIPQFDLEKQTCAASSRRAIKDKKDQILFQVCKEIYEACLMQGTCEIKNSEGRTLVNVAGKVDSDYRFAKVQNKTCRYGMGAGKAICLDPFHSIAADLSIYKLGQVIYIPHAVGIELPDGSKHDGYFVVRDSGGAIKGYGRFDFFTGFFARSQNPFVSVGFSDKETHVQYYVLEPDEAQDVLKKRNFPEIPVSK